MTDLIKAGLAALGLRSAGASVVETATDAWGFSFIAINGEPLPLVQYQGKAVLVVNTASRCGFTPQYKGLEELAVKYRERGLVVLGVPSNDFGGQEPGSSAEIKQFCELNFAVDFPLTEKVKVVGDDAHPFYQWADKQLGVLAKPHWNFHKYLIAPDGRLVDWFSSVTTPDSLRLLKAVDEVLPH
ncbi:MAG TPA: glutathione peroxidase [Patescibacteria group bacterium]|nr:glutathione peroxidase [Patescibacteria group bacterium]